MERTRGHGGSKREKASALPNPEHPHRAHTVSNQVGLHPSTAQPTLMGSGDVCQGASLC